MSKFELENLFNAFKKSIEGSDAPENKYFMDLIVSMCRSSYEEGFKAGVEEFKKSVSDY